MTTRSATSKTVTIFEGPDGGGKSTMAKEFATHTNARYVHHSNYPSVRESLPRMFLESMLPALLGYEDVVLDRSWESEPIYGDVFRNGKSRVTRSQMRALDRIALRCGGVIVRCLPPWEVARDTFNGRKSEELLDNDGQLRKVYDAYAGDYFDNSTNLNGVDYDFTNALPGRSLSESAWSLRQLVEHQREKTPPHPIQVASAGNLRAKILIVGESFAAHQDRDALYQLPFCGMFGGYSPWLNYQLAQAKIQEQSLLWVSADELERYPELFNYVPQVTKIVALGVRASTTLHRLGRSGFKTFPHPQYTRRFANATPYALIEYLKETIRDQSAS